MTDLGFDVPSSSVPLDDHSESPHAALRNMLRQLIVLAGSLVVGGLIFFGFLLFGAENDSLYHALAHGNYDKAVELIRLTSDVNQPNGAGDIALVVAADDPSADSYDMVRELLLYGARVDEVDAEGYTALHRATEQGNLAVVSLLLDHGADINAARSYTDVFDRRHTDTPLVLAYKEGHFRVAEFLTHRGADIPDNLETLQKRGEMNKLLDRYAKSPKPPNYTDEEWAREIHQQAMRKVYPDIAKLMADFDRMNPEAGQLVANILNRPIPEGVDEDLLWTQRIGEVRQMFESGQFEIPAGFEELNKRR